MECGCRGEIFHPSVSLVLPQFKWYDMLFSRNDQLTIPCAVSFQDSGLGGLDPGIPPLLGVNCFNHKLAIAKAKDICECWPFRRRGLYHHTDSRSHLCVLFCRKKEPAAAGKTSPSLRHVIKSQEPKKRCLRQPGRPHQALRMS